MLTDISWGVNFIVIIIIIIIYLLRGNVQYVNKLASEHDKTA